MSKSSLVNSKQMVLELIDNSTPSDVNSIYVNDMPILCWIAGGYLEVTSDIYDNLELIKLLIKKGADVEICDQEGRTPLMYAVQSSNFATGVNDILYAVHPSQYMKHANRQDNSGRTALMYSTRYENHLLYFSDMTMVDYNGKSIVSYVLHGGIENYIRRAVSDKFNSAVLADIDSQMLLNEARSGNCKAVHGIMKVRDILPPAMHEASLVHQAYVESVSLGHVWVVEELLQYESVILPDSHPFMNTVQSVEKIDHGFLQMNRILLRAAVVQNEIKFFDKYFAKCLMVSEARYTFVLTN